MCGGGWGGGGVGGKGGKGVRACARIMCVCVCVCVCVCISLLGETVACETVSLHVCIT